LLNNGASILNITGQAEFMMAIKSNLGNDLPQHAATFYNAYNDLVTWANRNTCETNIKNIFIENNAK